LRVWLIDWCLTQTLAIFQLRQKQWQTGPMLNLRRHVSKTYHAEFWIINTKHIYGFSWKRDFTNERNTHYIHSVMVQDFVSGPACCVNQYHYESRKRRVLMRFVHTTGLIQQWTATNNMTSCTKCSLPRVLYKFVDLISTLVICLKFVFIEMLDKLITYIVCWCKTLYQACGVNKPHQNSSLSWLVVILVHTTGWTWYKVLYHHTMYVMGISFIIVLLCLRSLHWRVFSAFQWYDVMTK
jgi:hypothetical protein